MKGLAGHPPSPSTRGLVTKEELTWLAEWPDTQRSALPKREGGSELESALPFCLLGGEST
jgi:hypothetical protein